MSWCMNDFIKGYPSSLRLAVWCLMMPLSYVVHELSFPSLSLFLSQPFLLSFPHPLFISLSLLERSHVTVHHRSLNTKRRGPRSRRCIRTRPNANVLAYNTRHVQLHASRAIRASYNGGWQQLLRMERARLENCEHASSQTR